MWSPRSIPSRLCEKKPSGTQTEYSQTCIRCIKRKKVADWSGQSSRRVPSVVGAY